MARCRSIEAFEISHSRGVAALGIANFGVCRRGRLAVRASTMVHFCLLECLPTGAVPASIDMNERTVPRRGPVQASPANKLRMGFFNPLLGGQNDRTVVDVDSSVMVEVVHHAISVVIDENVGGVPIHVPAEAGPAGSFAARRVVLRRAKSTHDVDPLGVDPVLLEIRKNQLELVDESGGQHEIFRPDIRLIVGQEVSELEMLTDRGVLISGVTSMNPAGLAYRSGGAFAGPFAPFSEGQLPIR